MEQSELDIRTLIEKCAQGDTGSYQALYDHMIDRVYAYIRYRTSTKEQATDIAQDVFIELWKALPRFTYQSREQFYAYVFVITKRKLSALYAKRDRETLELNEETIMIEMGDSGGEMSDEVSRALETLDEQTREIVVLHHWSRYTFKEIASLINMTETAVRVRHHRALKSLAAHIPVYK